MQWVINMETLWRPFFLHRPWSPGRLLQLLVRQRQLDIQGVHAPIS